MILQALVRCYDALAEAGRLEKPGWSPVKVSLALELDENGALLRRVPGETRGAAFERGAPDGPRNRALFCKLGSCGGW